MTQAGDHGPHFPEVLERVAEACDTATALRFAAEFGGAEIYIPANVPEGHKLATALGVENARRVANVLGQGKIIVPLGPASDSRRRKAEIARMIESGKSDMQIWEALKPRCHIETIRRTRRALGAEDPDQPGLFDGREKAR